MSSEDYEEGLKRGLDGGSGSSHGFFGFSDGPEVRRGWEAGITIRAQTEAIKEAQRESILDAKLAAAEDERRSYSRSISSGSSSSSSSRTSSGKGSVGSVLAVIGAFFVFVVVVGSRGYQGDERSIPKAGSESNRALANSRERSPQFSRPAESVEPASAYLRTLPPPANPGQEVYFDVELISPIENNELTIQLRLTNVTKREFFLFNARNHRVDNGANLVSDSGVTWSLKTTTTELSPHESQFQERHHYPPGKSRTHKLTFTADASSPTKWVRMTNTLLKATRGGFGAQLEAIDANSKPLAVPRF